MTDTCNMPPSRAAKWFAIHLTKAWKYPCQDGIMVSITCRWSDPCLSCNHYIHHEYSLMTNNIFKRRQLTFNPVPQEYTTYDQTRSQTTETIVFNLSTTKLDKTSLKKEESSTMGLLELICIVIITVIRTSSFNILNDTADIEHVVPPLGVLFVAGCGGDLLVNILFTLLGWVFLLAPELLPPLQW